MKHFKAVIALMLASLAFSGLALGTSPPSPEYVMAWTASPVPCPCQCPPVSKTPMGGTVKCFVVHPVTWLVAPAALVAPWGADDDDEPEIFPFPVPGVGKAEQMNRMLSGIDPSVLLRQAGVAMTDEEWDRVRRAWRWMARQSLP